MKKKEKDNLIKLTTEAKSVKVIVLSKEEKEVCSKPANGLLYVAGQVNDWINQGCYTNEVKDSLLGLAEHYISELRRLL